MQSLDRKEVLSILVCINRYTLVFPQLLSANIFHQLISFNFGVRDYWFLVEIRPSWVKVPAIVRQLDKSSGIVGFEADVGDKQFVLMNNPGPSELVSELPRPKGKEGDSLHTSLSDGIRTNAPATLSLRPRELAVLVSSPDSEDHLRGYPSFSEMIAHH